MRYNNLLARVHDFSLRTPIFPVEMLLDCIDFPDNVNVSLFERRVKLRHSRGVCVSAGNDFVFGVEDS